MVATPVRRSVPRRLRHRLGPWLDRVARTIAQPTVHVHPPGYVGTVTLPIDEFEAELQADGFAWDPLSTYHYTPEGSSTDGSWVYRRSWLADRQLHVVLFAQDDEHTDVYVHDEFSWLRHPLKHVGEVDVRRDEGVEAMRRWLDDRGLAYERGTPVWRKIRHAANRFRERFGGPG